MGPLQHNIRRNAHIPSILQTLQQVTRSCRPLQQSICLQHKSPFCQNHKSRAGQGLPIFRGGSKLLGVLSSLKPHHVECVSVFLGGRSSEGSSLSTTPAESFLGFCVQHPGDQGSFQHLIILTILVILYNLSPLFVIILTTKVSWQHIFK